MDASMPTGQSSTENSLQPHDPGYTESTGIDLSTPIGISQQRLREDSVFTNRDRKERFGSEATFASSSANSQPLASLTSLGSHDGLLPLDATPNSQKIQEPSCSLERMDTPQLILNEECGSSEGASLCPKLVLPEHDGGSLDELVLELEVSCFCMPDIG